MAKVKKAETLKEPTPPTEPMESVELEEDPGLQQVPAPDIEVDEVKGEQEEVVEEPSPDPSISAIAEGFNMLREELASRREGPPPIPVSVEESEEEFAKTFNDEVFKSDNPHGWLKKAIQREARKLVEQEVGPLLGSTLESVFEMTEDALKKDPVYVRFEPDVKKVLKTLSPAQARSPLSLKRAFDYVKSQHVDEIVDMKFQERVKAQPTKTSVRFPVSEGGSNVMPESGTRTIQISKSELASIRARAGELGIDEKELLARRGAK